MKDTEKLKNYCKVEVETNSILPKAYHIIDGSWFIATQNTLTCSAVCPEKQKRNDCKPTFTYNQTKHVLFGSRQNVGREPMQS